MEKKVEITLMRTVLMFISVGLFASGIINHDWFQFFGGVYLSLDDIEIIHWQGKSYH